MVRLTAELIEDSYQYMNPIREYELNLRGYLFAFIRFVLVKVWTESFCKNTYLME